MGLTVQQLSSYAQQACLYKLPSWLICKHMRAQKLLHTKEGEVDEGKVIEEQEPEEFACTTHAPESGR